MHWISSFNTSFSFISSLLFLENNVHWCLNMKLSYHHVIHQKHLIVLPRMDDQDHWIYLNENIHLLPHSGVPSTCKWPLVFIRVIFGFTCLDLTPRGTYIFPLLALIKSALCLWNDDDIFAPFNKKLLNFLERSAKCSALKFSSSLLVDAFWAISSSSSSSSHLHLLLIFILVIAWVMMEHLIWSQLRLVRSFASRIVVIFGSQLFGRD